MPTVAAAAAATWPSNRQQTIEQQQQFMVFILACGMHLRAAHCISELRNDNSRLPGYSIFKREGAREQHVRDSSQIRGAVIKITALGSVNVGMKTRVVRSYAIYYTCHRTQLFHSIARPQPLFHTPATATAWHTRQMSTLLSYFCFCCCFICLSTRCDGIEIDRNWEGRADLLCHIMRYS